MIYPYGYSRSGTKRHALIYSIGGWSVRGGDSACGIWCAKQSGDAFDPDHPNACKKCAKIVRKLTEGESP